MNIIIEYIEAPSNADPKSQVGVKILIQPVETDEDSLMKTRNIWNLDAILGKDENYQLAVAYHFKQESLVYRVCKVQAVYNYLY